MELQDVPTTAVPNVFFDKFLRLLDQSELMTYLCIVRHTSDNEVECAPISLANFLEATKVSKATQIKSLRTLLDFNIIVKVHPHTSRHPAWWALQPDHSEIDWDALWKRDRDRKERARQYTKRGRVMSLRNRVITNYPKLPTPRRGNGAGYVYVMRTGDGRYKIGFSNNPVSRSRNIYMDLVYWVVVDDMKAAEKSLHKQLKASHVKNEIFALTDSDMAYLLSLRAYVNGAWRTAK